MNMGFSAAKPIAVKSRGSWTGTLGGRAWQGHECGQHRHVKRVSISRSLGCNSRSDAAGSPGMIDGHDLFQTPARQHWQQHRPFQGCGDTSQAADVSAQLDYRSRAIPRRA